MLSTLPQLTVYMTFQVILIPCSSALDLTASGSSLEVATVCYIRCQTRSRYGDKAAEEAILCASTPAEAKEAGRAVVNFDRAEWDQVKKGVMLDLLREKFNPGSEMAKFLKNTHGKSLAEAGKSKSFAIGLSINHKNIFNTHQWPKDCNILGKCLLEIRAELNQ